MDHGDLARIGEVEAGPPRKELSELKGTLDPLAGARASDAPSAAPERLAEADAGAADFLLRRSSGVPEPEPIKWLI